MNFAVVGIDHNAPLEIREGATYTIEKRNKLIHLFEKIGVFEYVILSTCNRSEIYYVTKEVNLVDVFCNIHDVDCSNVYIYSGIDAINHLFSVASGISSLVIGEDQILGQVKSAHEQAMSNKTTGAIINKIFFSAITTAKKIKTETGISNNSLSISSVGIKLLKRRFESLQDKRVLVIGTGKMGRLSILNLAASGAKKILVTNRTHNKAAQLADEFDYAEVIDYNERYKYVDEVDIIISATSSPHHTLKYNDFLGNHNELCILDLAVPRDIDPQITNIDGVTVYTIDDLSAVVNENLKQRNILVQQVEGIIKENSYDIACWLENYKTNTLNPMFCPIMLDISNKNCVVFGGGKIALRKIKKLSEYGARITVVSPKIIDDIKDLNLSLIYDIYDEKYLDNAFIVVAATNDKKVNKEIYDKSIEKNLLILNVNGKKNSNIIFPAIKREGHITIAVSTNGTKPATAKLIRDNIIIPNVNVD